MTTTTTTTTNNGNTATITIGNSSEEDDAIRNDDDKYKKNISSIMDDTTIISNNNNNDTTANYKQYYEKYPLLYTMIQYETIRTSNLKEEGKAQMDHPLSSDGWITTLFIIRARALDHMIFPWSVAMIHAIIYTVVQEVWIIPSSSSTNGSRTNNNSTWEVYFSFVLNSTLSFLLVFRLNRAAGRFWAARKYWGDIVAQVRSCFGGIVIHGSYNIIERDNTIRWIVAFCICTMVLLRGEQIQPNNNNFAGILTLEEMNILSKQSHPPLYSIDKARYHLNQLFMSNDNIISTIPSHLIQHRSNLMIQIENQMNVMVWSGGGMERIKATPLPVVYVSHLRTFILISLLLYPWIFGPSWGYATIPAVAIAAFAWLGIENAAMEVEAPFRKERVNALNMDGYILGLLTTLKQQLQSHADTELAKTTTLIHPNYV